jgi:hypothetical protein
MDRHTNSCRNTHTLRHTIGHVYSISHSNRFFLSNKFLDGDCFGHRRWHGPWHGCTDNEWHRLRERI